MSTSDFPLAFDLRVQYRRGAILSLTDSREVDSDGFMIYSVNAMIGLRYTQWMTILTMQLSASRWNGVSSDYTPKDRVALARDAL